MPSIFTCRVTLENGTKPAPRTCRKWRETAPPLGRQLLRLQNSSLSRRQTTTLSAASPHLQHRNERHACYGNIKDVANFHMGEAINKHLHNSVAKGVVSEAGPQMCHAYLRRNGTLLSFPFPRPRPRLCVWGLLPAAEDRSQRGGGGGKGSPNALMQLPRGSCAPRGSDGRCLDPMADVRMQAVK